MLYHERQAKQKGFRVVIGIDEAGRGPLAGPVVVAAVSLKKYRFKNCIDDSKKLTVLQRQRAFEEIQKHSLWGVGILSESAIDQINVSKAADLAVDLAVSNLLQRFKRPRPNNKNTFLLMDGRLKATLPYRFKEIIGGDGKSLSIAAASIVAKVIRDRLMVIYDHVYPHYDFQAHKGYGTRRHVERIRRHGLCPIHRRTFCHTTTTGR